MYNNLRKLIFDSVSCELKETLWAKLPSYYVVFASGHLPTAMNMFGALTPAILFRTFFLNGAFGMAFGWLYRKYGIQYVMLGHAGTHIISKLIWLAK